jgi:hypothetical protein
MDTAKLWNQKERNHKKNIFLWKLGISIVIIMLMIGLLEFFSLYFYSILFTLGIIVFGAILLIITILILIYQIEKYDESYIDLSKYYTTGRFYNKKTISKSDRRIDIFNSEKQTREFSIKLIDNIGESLKNNNMNFSKYLNQLLWSTMFNNISRIHVIELEKNNILLYIRIYKYLKMDKKQDLEIFIGPKNKNTNKIIKNVILPEIDRIIKINDCIYI